MLASCLKHQTSDSALCKGNNQVAKNKDSSNGSTGRSVTFADFFGKRLEFVKTITPNSSFEDLSCFSTGSHGHHHLNQEIDLNNNISWNDQGLVLKRKNPPSKRRRTNLVKFLSGCLPQPLFRRDFDRRFEENNICLENIFVSSRSSNVLLGTVRVKNISYKKDIFVRYTLNRWKDYADMRADFTYQCSDGKADKFTFKLAVYPKLFDQEITGLLEFAIVYQVNNSLFWDNNYGRNYIAEYFEKL